MAWTVPWNLIALEVSGDIGDLTIYTDRFGKKVAFPKAPPDKPPTFNQIIQRERFKNAQASWAELSNEEKQNLELATLTVSAPLTGQNLWMSCNIRDDYDDLHTFERQSGIKLPTPIPRKLVGVCQVAPNPFSLINTTHKVLVARAITDTIRYGNRVDFAANPPFNGSFTGFTKNDFKFLPTVFVWNAGNGSFTHEVTFSFTALFGCETIVSWRRAEL